MNETTLKELDAFKDVLNSMFNGGFHCSPLSNSFYSVKVSSGFKPEGVVRVSDHWNFEMNDEQVHCPTHQEVHDNTHISAGVMKHGKFDIVASFKKNDGIFCIDDIKHTLFYDKELRVFEIGEGRIYSNSKVPVMCIKY